jgi:23S rRNA-/tRNA-specific pseudouridylate synthase
MLLQNYITESLCGKVYCKTQMTSAVSEAEPILSILVETPNYIIVDKPYDLCINGEKEFLAHGRTVASLLSCQRPDLVDNHVCSGFRFPHQLDYATSGALCITLNKKTTSEAAKLFKERKVEKEYLALVRNEKMAPTDWPYQPTDPICEMPSVCCTLHENCTFLLISALKMVLFTHAWPVEVATGGQES